ncbi:chorismate mutase [Bifidobacterium subtile]|jgi:chorismate mutase|uniref:Chorismate mutase n=2 Tax=Bifidobacterium subtile TaxID=77635 RepID=A0A087E7S8_9BIFI|nr:chorismate mutase [Bifidobacterium subtile]
MDENCSTEPCANVWGMSDDSENGDWRSTTIDAAQAEHNPKVAAAVERITQLRQSIDNIDGAAIALLAERFKATAQVGQLKAEAGFAPADYQREDYQIQRLHRIAEDAGLDPDIAEMYREFVVTETKKRHARIAAAGGDPQVLDVFA